MARRSKLRAIVHGKVQGVSFRAATREEASRLGLFGWVKNLSNGNVEVEAEGDDTALAAFASWLAHGPPRAKVDAVEASWVAADGDEKTFEVR